MSSGVIMSLERGSSLTSLPPKNPELKKAEEARLHGEDLTVRMHLPDGKVEEMKVSGPCAVEELTVRRSAFR